MRIVYHHRTRSTDAQRIHILEMVNAFKALGHEVEIVSLIHPETAKEDAKRDAGEAWWKRVARRIPFGYEALQVGYNLLGIPMLAARVLARRTDFIYERYSLFNFTGVAVARLFGVPIVLEVNSPFALEQQRDGDIRSFRFAAWSERVICNLSTRVIVVSTPLARILTQAGIRREKLLVMHNGVNRGHFAAQNGVESLRSKLNLTGRTVIGFIGWFRNWHGLDLLLRAFHRADLGRRGCALMLIGDGPAMPELQAYVKANRLEEHVIFTGPVPHAQAPPYLDLIDIAAQPAANEYCCPMKILEYMGMGKPMVAPRQENIEELVRDGEEALLFTPGDVDSMASALSRMLADPEAARGMGRKAYESIAKREFLWTANARKVTEIAQSAGKN